MNLDKISVILIISIVAFSGIISSEVASAQTWVSEDPTATSYKITHLTASIKVTIKNTNDHVQYFKMSQVYQGSLADNSTIQWLIDDTNPTAVKMVKSRSPELGGDYGWPIKAGETKTVWFKLNAVGPMGEIPSYIVNIDSTNKTYWPLINEPGLMGSWFTPNELEVLNPTLDIKKWTGTFSFRVTNIDDQKVYGIVRAPIAPVNSKLTSSNPDAFIDDETVVSTGIAAWNVVLNPGQSQGYTYTYVWPKTSSSSSTAHAGSQTLTTGSGSNPSVPSKETGVPYGLFIVGTLVTVAGVAYARFMR